MKFDALDLNMKQTLSGRTFVSSMVLSLVVLGALSGCRVPAEGVERGEVLYQNCATCHGADAEGRADIAAPAIAGFDAWYIENQLKGFQAGHRGSHADDDGGMRMRPMSLTMRSENDIKAVSEYLASLPATKPSPTLKGGDPGRGALYYKPCEACHGPDGAGMQALNSPALTLTQDWYTFKQLQHFKSGVRGARPGDVTGAQMAAMVASLPDEQAMLDVVAYIQKLK